MLPLFVCFLALAAANSCSGARGTCNCNCDWTNNGANCGTDDGTCCFQCCCAIKQCASCTCDCTWTNGGKNCGTSDGTCCFGCCCGGSTPPAPTPPAPKPPTTPPTTPPPSSGSPGRYCPSASDFVVAYNSGNNNPSLYNGGWTITGGAAVATKAAFNLIGGSVEYTINLSGCHPGVNANIYSISPTFSGSFSNAAYCDGQKTGSAWCAEVDYIESNGACGGSSTLHTRQGTGSNGCTAWGCTKEYTYSKSSFAMTIKFDSTGKWTTIRDGVTIQPTDLSPAAQAADWSALVSAYTTRGAVLYSSQWVGWVPVSSCPTGGSLDSSVFSISNLKINGTVVQGPTPTKC